MNFIHGWVAAYNVAQIANNLELKDFLSISCRISTEDDEFYWESVSTYQDSPCKIWFPILPDRYCNLLRQRMIRRIIFTFVLKYYETN